MNGNASLSFCKFSVFVLACVAAAGALAACNVSTPVTAPANAGPPVANNCSFETPETTKPERLLAQGEIEEIDEINRCLRVSGVWYWTDAETQYEIESCDDNCTFVDLTPGDHVKLVYTFETLGHALRYARSVEVENEDEDDQEIDDAEVEGAVEQIDLTGMRLRVGSDWFWADANTKVEIDDCDGGTFVDIRVGDDVKIECRTPADDGLGFYAMEIEAEPVTPCDEEDD